MTQQTRNIINKFLNDNKDNEEIYNLFQGMVNTYPEILNNSPIPKLDTSSYQINGLPINTKKMIRNHLVKVYSNNSLDNNSNFKGGSIASYISNNQSNGLYDELESLDDNIIIEDEKETIKSKKETNKNYDELPKYLPIPNRYFENSIKVVNDWEDRKVTEINLIRLRNLNYD